MNEMKGRQSLKEIQKPFERKICLEKKIYSFSWTLRAGEIAESEQWLSIKMGSFQSPLDIYMVSQCFGNSLEAYENNDRIAEITQRFIRKT